MRLKMMKSVAMSLTAPLAAGALLACTPQNAAETPLVAENAAGNLNAHPVSGLEVIPLTVTGVSGTHNFMVEVAASAEDQSQGLMFRTELGPNEGMIFPREGAEMASFWMKNTPLPLDIIFIGQDGLISNIAAQTVPYSTDPVTSVGVVSGVFEIAGGRATELGIVAGDKVEW